MNLQAGTLLACTDPEDVHFGGALVYLVEYDQHGAVGVIVNKPFGRSLNELQEFRHCPAFPLHKGGPVDTEHLFFLHRSPGLISAGTAAGTFYWGGNFEDAVRGVNNKTLTPADLKIFVGYCGWDAGDLEKEINSGGWTISEGSTDKVF
ncbi:MAG: YqgE/AlgH family protein [Chitinophagaceae bacterium]|nr:MAG: YqgE/AlgH family protein [Chitinophagaceae bacterium]